MADSQVALDLSEYAALGDWRTLLRSPQPRREGHDRPTSSASRDAYLQVASNRTLGASSRRGAGPRAADRDAGRRHTSEGIEGGDVKDAGEVLRRDARQHRRAHDAQRELKGGIKAALLPKKTRGGKVELLLALHWATRSRCNGPEPAA